jgi:hypothetical protein
MLNHRRTTYILLAINLALIIFIIARSGSARIEPHAHLAEPMQIRVLDQPPPNLPDTLLLNDFEKINDRMNMYDQGGKYKKSASTEHATHGKWSLLIEKKQDENIELATIHFPKRWDTYDALELDVYNDSRTNGTLWLRVGSQYDARRFYPKSQKYARAFELTPGANTIVVPVADIVKAFGRMPARKSIHFNFPSGGGERYFLDYLRMVRHDSQNQ